MYKIYEKIEDVPSGQPQSNIPTAPGASSYKIYEPVADNEMQIAQPTQAQPPRIDTANLGRDKLPSFEEFSGAVEQQKAEQEPKQQSMNQGLAEGVYQDMVDLMPSIMLARSGGAGMAPAALIDIGKGTAKALSRSVFGNMLSEGAKQLGAGPFGQLMAKTVGKISLSHIGANKAIENVMNEGYTKAKELGKFSVTTADKLRNQLESFKYRVDKTDFPGRDKVIGLINSGLKAVTDIGDNPFIAVDQIKDLKAGVNQFAKVVKDKQDVQASEPWMRQLSGIYRGVLGDFGKEFPEHAKHYDVAEEIYSAGAKANKFTEFMNQKMAGVKNPIVASALGAAAAVFVPTLYHKGLQPAILNSLGAGILGGAAAYGARNSSQLIDYLKSPAAQNVTAKLITNAVKEDTPAFERDLKRAIKIAEQLEKKKPNRSKLNIVQ